MQNSDSDKKSTIVRYKPGRRFYVFMISLVLATSFWLLNALNKTYTEGVDIVIKYVNLPENRAFSPVPHSRLKVELSGDGFSLVQLVNKAEEDTVVIDVSELQFENYGTKKRAHIPTSLIVNELRSSLSNNVNISKVNRDTIVVVTERGITKDLKVVPNYDLSITNGMVLENPIYSIPEIVRVHGPKSALDTATIIRTELVVFEDISESTANEIKLAYNSRLLHPNPSKVKVIADIEELTEGEISVPLTVVGLPKGKRVRLLPKAIKIKYSTGLSHYDFVEPQLFSVIVNYSDVQGDLSKLPVTIQSYPGYLNIIQLIPDRVDYLILDTQSSVE